ncbi:hypothetical protein GCM10027515_12630 [Schumannella luteola]
MLVDFTPPPIAVADLDIRSNDSAPRDPLRAAQEIGRRIVETADSNSRRTLSIRPNREVVTFASGRRTQIGPRGYFPGALPDLAAPVYGSPSRPFLGLIDSGAGNLAHVLRLGVGPSNYGSASWVMASALEQRVARHPSSLSALLRREGLSYGAALRLTTRNAPYLSSMTFAVAPTGLRRSLELSDEALRLARDESANLTQQEYEAQASLEVTATLAESERAAITLWSVGAPLPDIYREEVNLGSLWEDAMDRSESSSRWTQLPVTLIVGDAAAIHRECSELKFDSEWTAQEVRSDTTALQSAPANTAPNAAK